MARVLVRDIDDDTCAALKSRAERHGRSLEAEIRAILNETARHEDAAKVWAAIDRFHAKLERSRRRFSDSVSLIRKDRARA